MLKKRLSSLNLEKMLQNFKLYEGNQNSTHNCSEGSSKSFFLPIKKLTQLILISWTRWLLQSKLHRKEFRRKKLELLLTVNLFQV